MTKRDDDKADTSRMNDDKDKIVEMTDEDEVEIMKTQVSSDGHKPLVGIHRDANVNKTTQELGPETRDECGIRRRPRCRSWSYYH